jgi:hypothetical protein
VKGGASDAVSSLAARPDRLGQLASSGRWRIVACLTPVALALGVVTSVVGQRDLLFWGAFILTCAICAWHMVTAGRTHHTGSDALAPAPLFSLAMFVMFGLGSLYGWAGLDPLPGHPDPLPALVMAAAALTTFTIGYHLPAVARTKSLASRLPRWEPGRARLAALICVVIGVVGSVAVLSSTGYFFASEKDVSVEAFSILGFPQELLFVGMSMLAIVVCSTMTRRRAAVVLGVVALVAIAAFLPTGRRFYVFQVLAALGIPWHYYVRRISLKPILILGVIAILVLNPVGQLWRTGYRTLEAKGPTDIPAVASFVGDQLGSMTAAEYFDYTFGERFERVNEAATVAALRATVPSIIDYKYGQTYLPILTWLIPRLIWPDKPTFQYFNEIGRASGLIKYDNYDTAVVYTSLGELYLNFGDVGVLIGMLAIGMLVRWLYQALIVGARNETAVLAYAVLIQAFWVVQEALGPAFGGAIRDLSAGVLLLWMCGALRRPSGGPRTS